ncbi:DNA primase-like [Tenebrio molitor]|uniref:DNA primase-like n=1 Tax=Tenebrio molitor TaxID=7067 RepID=UPI003624A2BD
MKYESFARDNLPIITIHGTEADCRCVFHEDSKPSMRFNMELGVYFCHGCGARGNVHTLARHLGLGGVDTSVKLRDVYDALRRIEMPHNGPRRLPESFLSSYDLPHDYWAGRGLEEKTIKGFQLGAHVLDEFVTIPMRDINGNLLGVIKRYLDRDAMPRYRYPKNMKKSHHLFGAWRVAKVKNAKTVVLTEGSIDAMKVWQAGYPGMAILGSEVSMEQIKVLQALDVRRVILFFDDDKAGIKCRSAALGFSEIRVGRETKKTYRRDHDLRRYFSVESATYNHTSSKDPGDMASHEIDEAIADAYAYL